jgi:hypothetical protein
MRTGFSAVAAVAVLVVLVSVARGSAASERVESARAPRTDQRAFPRTLSFWKCGPEDEVARRDMIVGYAFCQLEYLRTRNPKGIFLLTPGFDPAAGGPHAGMHVTYGSALWHWRPGYQWRDGGCDKLPGPVNLGCMRAIDFDWDYMYNVDGSIAGITNGTDGHRGWNIAGPANRGTSELVAKFFAYTAKLAGLYTKRWDGVFSDNWTYSAIGLNWAYGPTLDTDRDGKVDEQGSLRKRWNDGLNKVGNSIRSYLPGMTVAGNGSWYPMWLGYEASDPQGWLKASNATMVEDISGFYTKPTPAELLGIASRWLGFRDPRGLPRYVLFQLDALTKNGEHLSIPSDANPNDPKYMLDPGVMRSMRWGLTLSLMAGAYYEIIVDDRHETLWWYDEYDGGRGIRRRGYLGQPRGQSVRLRAGVWRRDFEHGIALNNSTVAPVTIDLKRRFRHLRGSQNPSLNDGSVRTKIRLEGHDGVILLNLAQKPKRPK